MKIALQTYVFSRLALAAALAAGLSLHTAEAQTQNQASSPAISYALIAQDNVPLRAAPQASATQQAQLWQGELVELRGERMAYAQVWDHKRERGGYVRMSQLRRVSFSAADADGLMSVLQFVKDSPGSEGLTFGYGAAWLKAASPAQANGAAGALVLDAIAVAAERLAARASSGGLSKSAQEATAAQLDAAQRYGIRFESIQGDGMDAKVRVCYDGELFARLLAMPAASNEQRASAALALSRSDCEDPALALKNPLERSKNEEWRANVLDKADTAGLPGHLANRLHLRRASVWSTVAYDRARSGKTSAVQAAQRSLDALASVNKAELPEEEHALLNDAVMRVNASRWAAVAVTRHNTDPAVVTTAGSEAGQTCVSLVLGHSAVAKRCTFGIVWNASFSLNRERNAATLAVQTQAGWREMWVFRKAGAAWQVNVLIPAAVNPDIGYVGLAGWVPGGQQMLLAREARGEGKYKRSYEVMDLATLSAQRQATDPSILGAFQRWQQPAWKQMSVSLR